VPAGARIIGFVDYVAAGSDKEAFGRINVTARGWSASCVAGAPITRVLAMVDGKTLAETSQFSERPDVSAAYGRDDFLHSGWNLWFSLEKKSLTGHVLSFRAVTSTGDSQELPGGKLDLSSSIDK
jgi:hypothetical protein